MGNSYSNATICTIVSKNYLAHARVLARTFLRHHPGGQVFVLLVDEIEDYFDPTGEPFTTVLARELNIPNFPAMLFRYTVLELNTAVKPFFLEYLFNKYGCNKLCYFDPDITINHPLDEIFELLETKLMVLVPHLLDFLEDDYLPDEPYIMRAGIYNLGFIGVSHHPDLQRFLHWWQRRLEKLCVVAPAQGLFTDQRWIDLAPGFFEDVHIHRDPGCDVAYWNLNHRQIKAISKESYVVNGSPLKFFHFSGFSVDNIEAISKHQNRYTLDDLPRLKPIFETYRELLLSNGYRTVKNWPYAYSFFGNGVKIPDFARYLWREIDGDGQRWPNPANSQVEDSFVHWLNEPADRVDQKHVLLTNLALELYRHRSDVYKVFPDVLGRDRLEFARWFVTQGKQEAQIDEFFLEPVRQSLVALSRIKTPAIAGTAQPQSPWGGRVYLRTRDFLNQIGVGPRIKAVIGDEQVWKVRQLFFYGRINQDRLYRQTIHAPSRSLIPSYKVNSANGQTRNGANSVGLNVVGYLRDETGVGEVARCILKALHRQKFPIAQTSVNGYLARQDDDSVANLPAGNPYPINLLNINADQIPVVHETLGPKFFKNKHNIGFWFWELSQFPKIWLDRFAYVNEIWVGSSFVQGAIAQVAPVPVVNMRVPIIAPTPSPVTRSELGLPSDKHIFLFVFDGLSYLERKNPLGLIRAYQAAFEPHFKDTVLVIKATNLNRNPELSRRLHEVVDRVSGILIDKYMSRDELNGLFHTCDTYVSLHRSEGFGMTIAETMALGKSVIATGYSANMDFMTLANSYPVPYRLVELEQDYGPYNKGNVWANPDLEEAAALMRRVIDNPDEARRKGALAKQDVEQFYGVEAVSRAIINRLEAIGKWH